MRIRTPARFLFRFLLLLLLFLLLGSLFRCWFVFFSSLCFVVVLEQNLHIKKLIFIRTNFFYVFFLVSRPTGFSIKQTGRTTMPLVFIDSLYIFIIICFIYLMWNDYGIIIWQKYKWPRAHTATQTQTWRATAAATARPCSGATVVWCTISFCLWSIHAVTISMLMFNSLQVRFELHRATTENAMAVARCQYQHKQYPLYIALTTQWKWKWIWK